MVDLFTISVWTIFGKIMTCLSVVTYSFLNTEENTLQVPMSEVSSSFLLTGCFKASLCWVCFHG